MKGKTKTKGRIVKTLLLALSFVLTIVITASVTLAWFYDSDWASDQITMAGSVGIELREQTDRDSPANGLLTSGAGALHFIINDATTNGKAYPGQAIEMEAAVYNNGGDSKSSGASNGSECYVRAYFEVYTNIGDYDLSSLDSSGLSELEKEEIRANALMNAQGLYEFLVGLVDTENTAHGSSYKWTYWRNNNAKHTINGDNYHNGIKLSSSVTEDKPDIGFFYLCESDGQTLKRLSVEETAVFLWNSTFIIPWQLTNLSADKDIFIGVVFQAIQTFIPRIDSGVINNTIANNQLPYADCKYNNISVQTVFNSSYFPPISTVIGSTDYSAPEYVKASLPEGYNNPSHSGTAQANPALPAS